MRAKFIYESLYFERGKEVKSSLKIGKRHQIEEWFSLYAPNAVYTIDENLNITVKGDLYCSFNNLTSLPDNLTVNGDLDCSHNNLTSLPDNLTVNGHLYCNNNNLTSLPDNLTVNRHLYCINNNLTSLPDNLTVKGYLDCSHNNLPNNVRKPSGVNKMINK